VSKVLQTDELVPNIFLFMVAGYETTSTALAYSTYVLATRQDIQDRLAEEVKQNNNNEEDDYDTAVNLTYLDYFVREVLRMYPITIKAMTRECNATTTVCGHIVEEGLLTLQIDFN
jgi:cytochrome P450 family 13